MRDELKISKISKPQMILVVSDQFRHTVAGGSLEAKRNGRKSGYSLETQMQRLGICPVEFLDALERFLSRIKVQSLFCAWNELTPSYYLRLVGK